jgi:dephospho-CoA kinase
MAGNTLQLIRCGNIITSFINLYAHGRYTVSRWANKYVIGLTGNIGVGKSVVRQMLQHLGAYTIDADGLTHRAMAPGAPAYKPIIDTFGQFILDPDKNINRALLGQIVFSRPDALAKLEALVHPVVGQAVATLISRSTQAVIAVEAIKLLEGDLGKAVDEIWVVNASPETQLKRLMEKRKMSEADARQRIAAQNAQAAKLAQAQFVINNDGNVEETWKQVQTAWTNIQRKLQGAAAPPAAPAAPAQPIQAPPKPAAPPPAQPPAPAQPAAARPTPAAAPAQPVQAPPKPVAPPAQPPIGAVMVTVKRGMPTNAEQIANFIAQVSGKNISRMDVMLSFGQKSYLLALDQRDNALALLGWQVENLITRVDEFYMSPTAPVTPVIENLVVAIEAASKDLQSEVGYIFLPTSVSADTVQAFVKSGYESTALDQIKIPAWREAVQEIMNENKNLHILSKRLREDRVLKPI